MCLLCGVLTESYYMSIILLTISMLLGIDVFFHLWNAKKMIPFIGIIFSICWDQS